MNVQLDPLIRDLKDWTEDFHLENGSYLCHCSQCDSLFCGLKGRVTCRECASKNYRKDSSMSDHLAGSTVVAMFIFMFGSAYIFNTPVDDPHAISWVPMIATAVGAALATFICLRVGRRLR